MKPLHVHSYNRGPDLYDDGTSSAGNDADDGPGPSTSTSAVHRKERTPQQVM